MVMQEVQALKEQIKLNCNISDAKYWGYYSICGLLMRLRELYRNEHHLKPWERIDSEGIGNWIEKREALWQELEGCSIRPLRIGHKSYDPFDSKTLTEVLNSDNLVYGAGLSLQGKPTFFLAHNDKTIEINGYIVHYTSDELCRDLSASTAMQQAEFIYIRKDPLLYKLWNKYLELRGRRFGGALSEAFSLYGITQNTDPESVKKTLPEIIEDITDILLFHEIAEAKEAEDSEAWLQLLQAADDLKVELYLRSIKDIIADTSDEGPLKMIIETGNERLLNFYIVLTERIHRSITPDIMNAYHRFKESSRWEFIETTRQQLYTKALNWYRKAITSWKRNKDNKEIKQLANELSVQGLV